MTQLIENKNTELILIANKNGFFGQKMEGPPRARKSILS
jgi:hypothetical protein